MTRSFIKLFIKNSTDIKSVQVRNQYGNLSGFVGIACNAVLFAVKLLAGFLSGSISIISDAFNNLSDMASSIVTLLGFKLASKPADSKHPFGHGRMEYMAGLIVSAIIVVVGFQLVKSSVEGIINPEPIQFSIVSICILIASIGLKLWMYFFNHYISRAINSKTIAATAQDSLNDCVSTLAVLVCTFVSLYTPFNVDSYVGLIVSVYIIYGGFNIASEMLSQLLGEPPSEEFVADLKQRIMSYELFCGVHDLIVHDYGPGRCFASVHVEVPADGDMLKMHEEIDKCEKEIGQELNIQLVIHMDPVDRGETALALSKQVSGVVTELNPLLSIHDFRIVPGENRVNLIFDVVVPYSVTTDTQALHKQIQQNVSLIDDRYCCVIQFDRTFS